MARDHALSMTRLLRLLLSAVPLALGAAGTLAALGGAVATSTPAAAQFIDDRFPFFERRYQQRRWQEPWSPFPRADAPRERSEPTRPPPARRQEGATLNVVVLGDSAAEWLAYGLEEVFAETPEVGIVRKHRAGTSLIRTERGEDWPQLAREILAAEKADFVVMMIGIGDRQTIRERQLREVTQARPGPPAQPQPGGTQPQQGATPEGQEAQGDEQPAVAAPEAPGGNTAHQFRSEKWVEYYTKRLDDTIAALKAKGVPVLWVGLPAIRGSKSTSDMVFLNDLQRGRVEKARIVYVDNWDGFVDDNGAFTTHGPDVEGQIRRLRTGDGVNFTKAGARKLAHYVERELRRLMNAHVTPVALPIEQDPEAEAPGARPSGPAQRPIASPIMPLTGPAKESEELLGAGPSRGPADPVAARVLVKGEPLTAPAGRADDFAWPRREVATTTTALPPDPPPEPPATARPATPSAPRQAAAEGQPPGAAARPSAKGPPAASQQRPPPREYYQQPRAWPFFWPFGR